MTSGTSGVYVSPNPITQPQDFGDAPDPGTGTGVGNYNTRRRDNGPRHMIVSGLTLGPVIDGDSGLLQDATATADDLTNLNDEDGLVNPSDLVLTSGQTNPQVRMRVTNTTGAVATLYGWIDYDRDGLFEAGESSSFTVPSGTNDGEVTLIFPNAPTTVPAGVTTYARFRLSTDQAAASPTGPAPNGEVEDYRVTIGQPRYDFGDAPNSYTTTAGPRHQLGSPIYMGFNAPDSETTGQTTAGNASGDNDDGFNDEDGVINPAQLVLTSGQTNPHGADPRHQHHRQRRHALWLDRLQQQRYLRLR